jgi:hypothetical protein
MRARTMDSIKLRLARSEVLFELKELYVAREALVKNRTAAKKPRKSSVEPLAVFSIRMNGDAPTSVYRTKQMHR